MVDRHLQLSYMMVDVVGQHPPKMEKDPHWDVSIPEELPYTVASLPFRTPPAQTSAELLSIPIKEQQPIYPQYLESNDPKTLNNSTWLLDPNDERHNIQMTASRIMNKFHSST